MKKTSKIAMIVLGIIVVVVLMAGTAVYYLGHNLYKKSNYTQKTESVQAAEKESESETEATEKLSEKETEAVSESESETESTTETAQEEAENKKIYNILLIGVDRRDNTWNGNSDSMMLLSINEETEKLNLISLMRDTYVDIPEIGMRKLNAAHAVGGAELLLETVEKNYEVDVDRYITVDFSTMMDIVDQIGSITIEMSEAEVKVANGYISDMCNQLGLNAEEYLITGSGEILCNGMRAVAYARIRYVGNADYERTERQREVLSKLLENVKECGIVEMYKLAQELLEEVEHNFPEKEFWSLLLNLNKYLDYELVQDRIPYDDMYSVTYVNGQDMLVPDWPETIEKLHETLYSTEETTEEVSE